MRSYLLQIELATLSDRPKIHKHAELITSSPEHIVDEWLVENGLPKLSSWKYSGRTGSNSPSHHGVLNTLYLSLDLRSPPTTSKEAKLASQRLVITTHELVPIDPTTVL